MAKKNLICPTCHTKYVASRYHTCLPTYFCCLGKTELEYVQADTVTVREHSARAAAEVFVDTHVPNKKTGVPIYVLVRNGILITVCEVYPVVTTTYTVNVVSNACMLTDDSPDNPLRKITKYDLHLLHSDTLVFVKLSVLTTPSILMFAGYINIDVSTMGVEFEFTPKLFPGLKWPSYVSSEVLTDGTCISDNMQMEVFYAT